MADDPVDELLGMVFDFGDEGQYRATDVRERSVANTMQVEFEPENPNRGGLNKYLDVGQFEQQTARGDITQGTPDPRRVHQNRSEYAQKQDEARDARITTDPEQYASDPDSFDFPGVDTGPTFREAQGDFDEDKFIEDMFGMK